MRLQKYMAMCGVASRRKSEEVILQGKVKVNGQVVKKLGTTIEPKKDIVTVNGKKILPEENKVYIMINKPVGYVTTVKDEYNRKKVVDLIKGIDERIYPIGRLDYDTSGLLILTNDGELTYKITHPSFEINKTYIALVKGIPTEEELKKFRKGLKIDDYITSSAEIGILKEKNDNSIVKIRIHEGKNRQVRKMCRAIDHPVLKLQRIALENLELGDLKEREWRFLTKREIEYLRNI